MKIIGITGGIGSGKSKVLNFFQDKGIPCYDSDKSAKFLINSSSIIKIKIKKHFGNEMYCLDKLDTKALSKIVFNNPQSLKILNSIVHPVVADDFLKFSRDNMSSIIFKESAILFESESYTLCDYTILITAPVSTRIERVIKRDLIDSDEVKLRISNQWSDERKSLLANKIIVNIQWSETILLLEKCLIEIKNKFNIID